MTGMDSTTQAINALTQVYRIMAHHKMVTFIQVEHGFFEAKIRTWSNTKNTDDYDMSTTENTGLIIILWNEAISYCHGSRKNFLFSKTNKGTEDNAVIYSLWGSCEIVGANPTKWLEYTLTNLKHENTEEELVKLLPCNFV